MSIHARFDNPIRVGRLETAPIVLRFASMFPRDLKRREMHDKRTGGDLTHIRTDLSHLNTQPVGEPDWIEHIHAEIEAAKAHNHEQEIAARERKGRFLEAERLRERGPVDPWKFTRGGPLREGIITVNKLWFGGTGQENWDPDRVEAFKQRAIDFLLEHFPDGQLREVNIDEDEEALHFHFAVVVWVEKVSQNRGSQRLLQPSANPLLANYEHAQDIAGEAFLDLGIHRGERRAAAARAALAAGLEMPQAPWHVPPSHWRREQRRLALEDRDRIRADARAEAAAIVDDGVALAKAAVKKSRKRAIKEARARKAETVRQVATAERDLARAESQADAARHAKLEAEAARIKADRRAEATREEAARITQTAENRAGVIVADAAALATVAVRKSRKRSIAEAKTRRAAADRAVAVAERTRSDAEALAAAARAAQETAEDARCEADRQAEEAHARSARIIGAADDRAATILSDAKLVGSKALKKARKRAARETQGLRDEIRRMKADTALELRRGQLAAAFVRGRTARLQDRARSLSRDIEAKVKIWTGRERQHRDAEVRLAQIKQDRAAAEAAITQAQETAAGIVAAAEARAKEAREAQKKADADRADAERLVLAAQEKASQFTQAAEDRAGMIMADAAILGTATVRKSRKRAIAEAKTRRAKSDRAAAAAERERVVAEARAERARKAQARAQTERVAAEDAAVSAREEAVRVKEGVEAEADRIRTEASAAAEAEQARAKTARQARDEAVAARLAADQAAAEAIRKAEADRSEAVRAVGRADAVMAGLAALTEEISAGTLSLREDGGVTSRAPELLRPAYPEIGPAVRAAATAAEQIRAARREADAVARATDDARKAADAEIARDKAAATDAIAQEREAAQVELKNQREAVTSELDEKRAELDRQETEVNKQWAFLASLLDRFEPLPKKVMRWLSHPDRIRPV